MARTTTPLSATQGVGTGVAFRDVTGGTFAQGVDNAPWEPTQLVGAQKLVVGTTVVGTVGSAGTFTIPSTATHLYMSVESQSSVSYGVRFWNTGDTPTAGTAGSGHMLGHGAGPLEFDNIALLKMVTADSSAAGTVQLSYHKYV